MLDTINSVLQEHQAIQAQVDLLKDSIREWEELSGSDKSDIPDAEMSKALSEKQLNLQHAVSNLSEGFLSHHINEEKILEPILGELLDQALVYEHKIIVNELNEIGNFFLNANLHEPLPDREKLKNKLDNICQLISEHSFIEDNILIIARKYLEQKPGHPQSGTNIANTAPNKLNISKNDKQA